MQHVCVDDLTPALAGEYLREECAALEKAECAAVLARGARKRMALQVVRLHRRNVLALAERADGPIPADVLALSDGELLAELAA